MRKHLFARKGIRPNLACTERGRTAWLELKKLPHIDTCDVVALGFVILAYRLSPEAATLISFVLEDIL